VSAAALVKIDHQNRALAVWPLCPCGTGQDGAETYTAVRHEAGFGGFFYFPGSGLSLSVRMDPPPPAADEKLRALSEALSNVLRRARPTA
jgi:hypothetical protein